MTDTVIHSKIFSFFDQPDKQVASRKWRAPLVASLILHAGAGALFFLTSSSIGPSQPQGETPVIYVSLDSFPGADSSALQAQKQLEEVPLPKSSENQTPPPEPTVAVEGIKKEVVKAMPPQKALKKKSLTPINETTPRESQTNDKAQKGHDEPLAESTSSKIGAIEGGRSLTTSSGQGLANYSALVGAWLNQHKKYPRRARERGIEGRVEIALTLSKDGQVKHVEVVKSSSSWLDEGVIKMVEDASPFPAAPQEFSAPEISLVVPIVFKLVS